MSLPCRQEGRGEASPPRLSQRRCPGLFAQLQAALRATARRSRPVYLGRIPSCLPLDPAAGRLKTSSVYSVCCAATSTCSLTNLTCSARFLASNTSLILPSGNSIFQHRNPPPCPVLPLVDLSPAARASWPPTPPGSCRWAMRKTACASRRPASGPRRCPSRSGSASASSPGLCARCSNHTLRLLEWISLLADVVSALQRERRCPSIITGRLWMMRDGQAMTCCGQRTT